MKCIIGMTKESRVRSLEYLQRRVLFDGMDYLLNGKPFVPVMDVDAIMDCHGRAWILYECKYGDALPPLGQKITLERMVNDFGKGGRPAVALICSHGDEEPVYLKDCIVTGTYSAGTGWRYYGENFSSKLTAKELTDRFLQKYAPEMLFSKGG